jgi:radical SAM-linked protein
LSEVKQFFRFRFSKEADLRFISHHDLMRLFERALRRTHLPVAMSEGFNPRPRISLPASLSVGISGRSEVLDFELDEWIRPDEVMQRLAAELPDGIELKSLQNPSSKPDRCPTQLSYMIPLLEGHPVAEEGVRELLAAEQVLVRRRRKGKVKELDIRPFIERIRCEEGAIRLLLRATEHGTARPEEVLEALGCRPGVHYLRGAVQRTHVNLSSAL